MALVLIAVLANRVLVSSAGTAAPPVLQNLPGFPSAPRDEAPSSGQGSGTGSTAPVPFATVDRELLRPVGKDSALPQDYEPSDLVVLPPQYTASASLRLRREAAQALTRMLADAEAAGLRIVVSSAYRSYGEQQTTHAYWVSRLGQQEADRISARPGHSEHQLGTAVDLTSPRVGGALTESFGTSPEGRWLQEHAARYGFVMSYPEGKEAVTGYAYEPWHWRYVGAEVAQAVAESGLTLSEWLRWFAERNE